MAPPGFDQGGDGGDLLVLIHGLGATSAVWQPMLAQADKRWPGRWIAPDLRGHGRQPRMPTYAPGQYAADIADLVANASRAAERVIVLGHSLGGVVGLTLATGLFGVRPHAVLGLGIKVSWSDDDLVRISARADQPSRTFDTEVEAAAKYAGSVGIALPELASPAAIARGWSSAADGWHLSVDPAAFRMIDPQVGRLVLCAACPVHLACGELDPMVTREELLALDGNAVVLGGLGHNAMIEDPHNVWDWVDACLD